MRCLWRVLTRVARKPALFVCVIMCCVVDVVCFYLVSLACPSRCSFLSSRSSFAHKIYVHILYIRTTCNHRVWGVVWLSLATVLCCSADVIIKKNGSKHCNVAEVIACTRAQDTHTHMRMHDETIWTIEYVFSKMETSNKKVHALGKQELFVQVQASKASIASLHSFKRS